MNSLVELGDIAEAVYHTEQEQTLEARIVPPPQAFAENTCSPAVGESLGVVEKFLIDTLHRQTALRSRKDFSYSTITRWRAPIKRYQVDALKILKQHCPKTFVTAVAHDLVAAASRLIGRGNISWVTHVPCGHSAGEMCFMNEVAQQTADLIDVKFVPVFAREQRPGSSHPRQSANLKPFKLCADVPDGTALLLDDVASSGAHMENAMRALKTKCSHVSGIAWIGDK